MAGVAVGNMRLDGIRMNDLGKGRPQAQKARERMENRESLTDQIVSELGGSRAAEYQTNGYEALLDRIKNGNDENGCSLAATARRRMIDRQGGNDGTDNGGHPDIGNDKANRRAYPKGIGSRTDSEVKTAYQSRAEAIESAKAFANAGTR